MRLTIIITIIFVLTIDVMSIEWRKFTNKEGNSIIARLIECDEEGGRVLLERKERKNRKKAWIEISSFSEEDQDYIQQWNKNDTEETYEEISEADKGMKNISEEEVRAIGDKYVEAIMKKDYTLWKSLFFDFHHTSSDLNERNFYRITEILCESKSISQGGVNNNNVRIIREDDRGHTGSYWLQLLPNGDIKYDIFTFLHPFDEVAKQVRFLANRSNYNNKLASINKNRALEKLKELGVPTFDYEVEGSYSNQKRSVKKIVDWLLEELDPEWDVSEPKLALPTEGYKNFVSFLKNRF